MQDVLKADIEQEKRFEQGDYSPNKFWFEGFCYLYLILKYAVLYSFFSEQQLIKFMTCSEFCS